MSVLDVKEGKRGQAAEGPSSSFSPSSAGDAGSGAGIVRGRRLGKGMMSAPRSGVRVSSEGWVMAGVFTGAGAANAILMRGN